MSRDDELVINGQRWRLGPWTQNRVRMEWADGEECWDMVLAHLYPVDRLASVKQRPSRKRYGDALNATLARLWAVRQGLDPATFAPWWAEETDRGETMNETVWEFTEYFNVADELWGELTLDDLARDSIDAARRAADRLGLPWPPYLPAAEEYALDHQELMTEPYRADSTPEES